ncbi:MAG: CdaR family protein [Clostridia bacterium]|nr:CdaR family protein [Clostridia bacterium]
MTKFYRRNVSIKVVSVLLAVLLWVYVGNLQNPTVDRMVPNVPLEHRGLPGQLAVSTIPAAVQVRVQGLSNAINNFSPRELKAHVNLEEVKPGVNWLPVKVTGVPSGLRVATVQPEQIKVEITTIGRKQIPIHVEYHGETALGFGVTKPVLKPEVVVLRGPVEKLDQVARAIVTVELQGTKSELVEYLPAQLVDSKGRVTDSRVVQFEPKVIEVRVPVVKTLLTREIPVKVLLQGEPAPGFRVERIVASPVRVVASGEEKILKELREALTLPVSIAGKDRDFTVEAGLEIPAGVTFDRTKVQVEIKLKALEEAPKEKVPEEVYGERSPQ